MLIKFLKILLKIEVEKPKLRSPKCFFGAPGWRRERRAKKA